MNASVLRLLLEDVVHDKTNLSFGKTVGVIGTDPGDRGTADFDDVLMLFYLYYAEFAQLYIVVGGGDILPDERLAYIKKVLPVYANATFGVPFDNARGGSITFLQDGLYVRDDLDWFANCAPLSEPTLTSIAKNIKFGGLVTTVGATAEGKKSGLNQRTTGPDGWGTDFWDEGFLLPLLVKGCKIENLAAATSREVLTPNPRTLPADFKINQSMDPEALNQAYKTAYKFLVARPPAEHPLCLRFNQSNTAVTGKMIGAVLEDAAVLLEATAKVALYSADPEIQKAALYPVYHTLKMGGVYVDAKLAVLTPESETVVFAKIQDFELLPPAYDLLACIMVDRFLARPASEAAKRPIE